MSAQAHLSCTVPITHGTKHAHSEGGKKISQVCGSFFFTAVCYAMHGQRIYQSTCLSSAFRLFMLLNIHFRGVSSVQTRLTWEHSVNVKHRQLWNPAVCAARRHSPVCCRSPSRWGALPSQSLVSHLPLSPKGSFPLWGAENTCRYTTHPCSCYTLYTPFCCFPPFNHLGKRILGWVVSRKKHRGSSRRHSLCSTPMAKSVMGEGRRCTQYTALQTT